MSIKDISQICRDPKYSGFFGAVERVLRPAKQLHVLSAIRLTIQEYLRIQKAYILHKPASCRLTNNHNNLAGINGQWQDNLANMQNIVRQKNKFLLTVINVF